MGTELFKVTCVTCQASLSVRNPALVDQIVACPKCDSMVHVVPPPAEPAPSPVEAAPVVVPPATVAPEVEPSAFEAPIDPSAGDSSTAAEVADTAAEVAELAEIASVVNVAGSSQAHFIMLAAASFVVGVTLTGTFLLLRSGDAPPSAVEPADVPSTQSAVPAHSPAHVAEAHSDSLSETVTSPGVVADPEPTGEAEAIIEPDVVAASDSVEPPPDPEVELTEPATDEASPVAAAEAPTQKLVIASADEPRTPRKFDPLAIDPEELDLGDMTQANLAEQEAVALEEDAPAEPDAAERAVTAVVPVKLDTEASRAHAHRVASIQVKRKIPALAIKEMPLLDFLTLMSQLAGVPVSVGPEQLQMAGIRPGRPVTVDVENISLGEVLEQVLKPLHLEVITDGAQITIIRRDAERFRSVDYPVDDLLGAGLSSAEIGSWIERLIAPESWESAGGKGTITASSHSLRIEQEQGVQYQILFFVERIRVAKGIPLRSKYPARLLTGKPYGVGIADRMEAPTTFTFSHSTPIAEIFHYWQGEAGLPIFVDWPALADLDLWPDTRVTCTITNEPWQSAFDKILGPLDLAWRAAPGGAVQITSRARVATEPVVDIYPAGTWRGEHADAVVISDTVNGLTYVRAPAAAHRQ